MAADFLYILSSFSRATFKLVYMRNGRRFRVLLAEPTIHVKHQDVQSLAECFSHSEFHVLQSDTVLTERNMLPKGFLNHFQKSFQSRVRFHTGSFDLNPKMVHVLNLHTCNNLPVLIYLSRGFTTLSGILQHFKE